ncbi:hypothetical protein SO802_021012 [Lithocarpus litseifolius]|uniref:RNase H type-1 domain-containing protein n=1 Tax=Lithocarpus litseifolius TaxID=425828 RepID=A0AAW2CEW9_9ROSI
MKLGLSTLVIAFLNKKEAKNLETLIHTLYHNQYICQVAIGLIFTNTSNGLIQNQIRTSNHKYPSHQIVPNAIANLNDFLRVLPSTPTSLPGCKPNRVTWSPSSSHFLKVNFNGDGFKEEGEAGIRAVIQNENGLVVASILDKIMLPQSLDEVELR